MLAALTAALTGACSGSSDLTQPLPGQMGQPVPSTLEAITSTSHTGTVGTAVTPAPTVRVKDRTGNPVRGVVVTFLRPADPGGVASNTWQLTDKDGIAISASWTLGPTPRAYSITARTVGLPDVVFSVTAAAGPVARITRMSGSGQREPAGSALAIPLGVRVADSFDNPVAGATVTFTVVSGGGALADAGAVLTDVEGMSLLERGH